MGKDLKGKELGRGLTQRPDGRYMARAQVAGKSVLLYGWKLRTLKKEFAEAVEEARKGSIWLGYETDTLTLNEWFEEWYEKYKAPTLKNGGSAQYRRKFVNYYGVRIGSKNLKDIRQLHVQTAIADMLEAGRSSKSVREATGILQNCIEAAMANGLTSINPTVGVVIPKCDKVERRVLTVEEQEIFIEHLERTKSWYEEMYKLMLLTGMRIGDADGKISLNQQKPSKHAGLRRFGPEKFLQRNNEFMKERPIFYKKPIKTEKDFSTWLRCFYYTTKAVITEYIYF